MTFLLINSLGAVDIWFVSAVRTESGFMCHVCNEHCKDSVAYMLYASAALDRSVLRSAADRK